MKSDLQTLLEPIAAGLTPDDLRSDDLRWLAETVGMKAAVSLAMGYPGMSFYIPKRCQSDLKLRYLRKHYTGSNMREMCRLLDISQTTAKRWLRESSDQVRVCQTDLFGGNDGSV